MPEREHVTDRRGRVWTVSKVSMAQSEDEDFRFWFEQMTPDERVVAVYEALESSLKAKGIHAVPRFRKVCRRVRCPWSLESHGRGKGAR